MNKKHVFCVAVVAAIILVLITIFWPSLNWDGGVVLPVKIHVLDDSGKPVPDASVEILVSGISQGVVSASSNNVIETQLIFPAGGISDFWGRRGRVSFKGYRFLAKAKGYSDSGFLLSDFAGKARTVSDQTPIVLTVTLTSCEGHQ